MIGSPSRYSSGETIAGTIRKGTDGCYYLTRKLMSEETIRAGQDYLEEGIPLEVVFPDPMPVGEWVDFRCFR